MAFFLQLNHTIHLVQSLLRNFDNGAEGDDDAMAVD